MSGFDFGQIGDIISTYMDTDSIDIKRNVLGELQTVYANVPCHVTYRTSDNADPYSISTKPIITTLEIHMDVSIDVRNDDYIVIKKVSGNNVILQTYSGRCGEPVVDQARKKILVTMSADDSTEPEPLPPTDPSIITISCVTSMGEALQADIKQYAEKGKPVTIYPPAIDDYVAIEAYLNDEKQENLSVTIENVTDSVYLVSFEYEAATEISYMRLLLNGLYTKDNGSLASGYYLYKKMPLTLLASNGSYDVTMEDITVIQEDTGDIIRIEENTKAVLFAGYVFAQVESIEELVDSYRLKLVPYEPTEEERKAYLTEWYDE